MGFVTFEESRGLVRLSAGTTITSFCGKPLEEPVVIEEDGAYFINEKLGVLQVHGVKQPVMVGVLAKDDGSVEAAFYDGDGARIESTAVWSL